MTAVATHKAGAALCHTVVANESVEVTGLKPKQVRGALTAVVEIATAELKSNLRFKFAPSRELYRATCGFVVFSQRRGVRGGLPPTRSA